MRTNLLNTVERCPNCNAIHPHVTEVWQQSAISMKGDKEKPWTAYLCNQCEEIIPATKFVKYGKYS